MNIFSKELLYKKNNRSGPKAYLLLRNNVIDVYDLGFTEPINISTTKGTSDDSIYCNYVILNGKLFYYDGESLSQVGSLETYSAVSGYYYYKSKTDYCDPLFLHSGNNPYLLTISSHNPLSTIRYSIGTSSTVSISSISGYISNNCDPIYIRATTQKIYSGYNVFTTNSTWKKISGSFSEDNKFNAYGITSDGVLGRTYYSASSSPPHVMNKVSSDISGWTAVCGYYSKFDSSDIIYGYGIATKMLYYLSPSASKIGTLKTWTKISGKTNSLSTIFGYGIAGGSLYSLCKNTATKIDSETTWMLISGFSKNGTDYAYGSKIGNLYSLNGTTITDLQISNCIAIYGTSTANYPALAVCSE